MKDTTAKATYWTEGTQTDSLLRSLCKPGQTCMDGECQSKIVEHHRLKKSRWDKLVATCVDDRTYERGVLEDVINPGGMAKDCRHWAVIVSDLLELDITEITVKDAFPRHYAIALFRGLLETDVQQFKFYRVTKNGKPDVIFETLPQDGSGYFDLSTDKPSPRVDSRDEANNAITQPSYKDGATSLCKDTECLKKLKGPKASGGHGLSDVEFNKFIVPPSKVKFSLELSASDVDKALTDQKAACEDAVELDADGLSVKVIKAKALKRYYPVALLVALLQDAPDSFVFYSVDDRKGKTDVIFYVLKGGAVVGYYDLSTDKPGTPPCH